MESIPLLSILIFTPVIGMLSLIFVDNKNKNLIRSLAFGISAINFLVSLLLLTNFKTTHEMQFVEKHLWIKDFGVYYSLGVDGISLFLVLLTTLTAAICFASTWKAITKHVKEFMISMLMLEAGMIGTFCALDFFLFYIFWEVMLIPMYFIIGIWGGQRRIYAAVKFFLYTMIGSVLMLVAIIWMYFHYNELTGEYSLDILSYHGLPIDPAIQIWLFLAFFLAFAIKVPMFPFHTWLPDAHVEAPTAGSVILAGILLKMGTYGFLRFSLPIFPEATIASINWISVLAIIGIVYGALVAMVQSDIKKLVAYSSVSHLGFVVLGIFALNTQAIEGGLLQMINHGLSTGALFLIVGVLYERRHTRLISEYGGIAAKMPIFAVIFMVVTLSSIGLPGLNGFVGEFLILLGVWESNKLFAILASTGVVWAAIYMLWMYQRVMFGKVTNPKNMDLQDLNLREISYFAPLLILIFVLGIFPTPVIKMMEPSVVHLIDQVGIENRKPLVTVIKEPDKKSNSNYKKLISANNKNIITSRSEKLTKVLNHVYSNSNRKKNSPQ
ncbi:MAG TPA: NADH-quinone oxidoreductase subunit M [Nitrospinota bacterium]|nr:NADH-quinone oxidoreductase subunit M [Nitrospinota bacterium]|tara:strand:+ start:98858 stop:100516 length:1659 start_codon:yes stop_codon:yes gene_type:complete